MSVRRFASAPPRASFGTVILLAGIPADYSLLYGGPRSRPQIDFGLASSPNRNAHTRHGSESWTRLLAVFAKHGYAAGTTNRIAEEAELSIGSLYQYFPNKDAILRALMTEHADAGTELIRQRLSGGLPPRLDDTLRLFVRATIDNHRDNPRLHRVLFEEAPRAPAFLKHLHDMEQQVVDATVLLLEQHPGIHASRLKAQIIVTTIESLLHRLITSPSPVDPRQLEEEIVTLLSSYLGHSKHSVVE